MQIAAGTEPNRCRQRPDIARLAAMSPGTRCWQSLDATPSRDSTSFAGIADAARATVETGDRVLDAVPALVTLHTHTPAAAGRSAATPVGPFDSWLNERRLFLQLLRVLRVGRPGRLRRVVS